MAGHGSPQGGADCVSSLWLSCSALPKLSGAGAVRGQLQVGQELRQAKASPRPHHCPVFLPAC